MSQQQNAKPPQSSAPKTAITPTREANFPEWYQAVIKAADMAENAPVRGCMIIKPYGYAVWEHIQRNLDAMIKNEDVQNAYFPLLIPLSFLAKEAEHIDGFAKECAIVTHHRLTKNAKGELVPDPESALAEPMIIRPTSETIIGDAFAKWVQSYRDLPLKINQWANVMRWEMRPRMFLRTSEFLWQEGHNVFETADQANADARKMLDVYATFAEEYLAIPVIKGEKTPEERFPGAIATYTIEAIMQDGKALQSATSHDLGQTFAKSANIVFQGRDGAQSMAYTTSWGMSTRTIGGLIMTHADDDGMVMPPRLAPYHVLIIPIIHDEKDKPAITAYCDSLQKRLKSAGLRVQMDVSDARTPDKMWGCIKKGVPYRVEIGAREMAENKVTYARRDLGKAGKGAASLDEFVAQIGGWLETMQKDLLKKAQERLKSQIHTVKTLAEVKEFFTKETKGCVRMDVAFLKDPAFEGMKKEFSISARCIPFEDGGKFVIVGKAY